LPIIVIRFPVIIDGGLRRLVLKMTSKNELLLFDDQDSWIRLAPDCSSDLEVIRRSKLSVRMSEDCIKLADIRSQAISETYGREWHRASAVESPLKVLADEGNCIFKVFRGGRYGQVISMLTLRNGHLGITSTS